MCLCFPTHSKPHSHKKERQETLCKWCPCQYACLSSATPHSLNIWRNLIWSLLFNDMKNHSRKSKLPPNFLSHALLASAESVKKYVHVGWYGEYIHEHSHYELTEDRVYFRRKEKPTDACKRGKDLRWSSQCQTRDAYSADLAHIKTCGAPEWPRSSCDIASSIRVKASLSLNSSALEYGIGAFSYQGRRTCQSYAR